MKEGHGEKPTRTLHNHFPLVDHSLFYLKQQYSYNARIVATGIAKMSGTGPNNNHNNNGQMNPQNFLLQQQFAQQQQQQQGNTFQQGGFAGANAQQQRMLQMQLQQQQMQLQQMQSKSQQQQQPGTRSTNSAMPNNPLAPAPATLNRGNMMASNAISVAPPLGRMNSSATTGGSKTKGASKLGRAGSNAIPGPPGLVKATTSSMSIANIANNNTPTSEQQTQQLLTNCDWKDRTMWVSRQLLGGNATNGFLRATATVQRIKRQRARQTAQSKKKAEAEEKGEDGAGATPEAAAAAASKEKEKEKAEAKKRDTPDQASEEILKKEIMNPRTAKKLKQELEAGLSYCVTLQNAIRTIIMEMDPQIAVFTPLPLSQGGEIPRSAMLASASMAGAAAMSFASMPIQKAAAKAPPVQAQEISQPKRRASEANAANAKSTATQASPGGAGGSTLRKNRKKKLPSSTEKSPELAEFDAAGKRSFSKKEHTFRLFEVIRFRALKAGDFVAARVSSRDLWILARVQRDFPGFSMPPNDFLKLSEARRDGHFREKVAIKDVEESGTGGISMVPRNLVLPLPRTFSEAAEWCQRYV